MIQGAWGWCTGTTQRDGMRREAGGGSGWGTCVHPWRIHVDVWQNQYNIVKLKKKVSCKQRLGKKNKQIWSYLKRKSGGGKIPYP